MRTWNISLYNAYNAMNPNIVYSKWQMERNMNDYYDHNYNGKPGEAPTPKEEGKTIIKKLTILPCIPSVTYTYKF